MLTEKQWLQVKGDPSIRGFLFQQTRVESEFDRHVDAVLKTVETLLTQRGIFHVVIHFSSNQLTCWHYHDPFRYQVHVGPEICTGEFMDRFEPYPLPVVTAIPLGAIAPVLAEFKRLRFRDENIYLRNASINLINGIIGMSFSCDGSHYLTLDQFNRAAGSY